MTPWLKKYWFGLLVETLAVAYLLILLIGAL